MALKEALVWLFGLGAFGLGLVLGSFMSVLVYRWPKLEGLVSGRSRCQHCRHSLSFSDLIPIISFFWLRGRCRYCRKGLDISYPAIELSLGLVYLASLLVYQPGTALDWLSLFLLLVVLFFTHFIFWFDLKYLEMPTLALWLLAFSVGLLALFDQSLWGLDFNFARSRSDLFFGLAIGGLTLGLITFFSKGRAMGSGDGYLAAIFGFLLGFEGSILMLLLAFIVGGAVGAFLLVLKKRQMKDRLAFGPFLVIGFWLMVFFGQSLKGLFFLS